MAERCTAEKTTVQERDALNGQATIKSLQGLFGRPFKRVSIEDMNAAIVRRGDTTSSEQNLMLQARRNAALRLIGEPGRAGRTLRLGALCLLAG